MHNKIKVHKGVDIAGEREEPSLIVSVANEALPTHYCCTLLSIQQADGGGINPENVSHLLLEP